MPLKDTVTMLNKLLNSVSSDLVKAVRGNKAASQRVRTGTIKLEKVAKKYRKESISSEKKGGKKPKKAAKKKAPKKKVTKKKVVRKAKPKAKRRKRR